MTFCSCHAPLGPLLSAAVVSVRTFGASYADGDPTESEAREDEVSASGPNRMGKMIARINWVWVSIFRCGRKVRDEVAVKVSLLEVLFVLLLLGR